MQKTEHKKARGPYSFQYEQYDTYVALGLVSGEYFALLDRIVYDDDFYDLFGSACVNKLGGRGGHKYTYLGEMISDSLDEVAANCHLTDAEREAVASEVRRLGLHFRMDTAAWRSYRSTKPSDFRLLQLEVLNSRFAGAVRQYFSRSPSQTSPSI